MNDDTLAKVKAIIDGVPNQKKLAIIKERIAVVTKRRTMLKGDKGDKGGDGIAGAIGKDGAKGDAGTKGIDGAKGADGLRGATGEAGRVGAQGAQGDVGINWLGDWRRGTVYSIGDLVRIGEDVYLCIVANANEPAGLIGWIKLSQRGARGAQGAGGFRGEAGAAGTSGSSAAEDLTGTTLASNVVASSLTSLGVLTALNVLDTSLTPAKITSTDAGVSAGPLLILDRNSASPADNDLIGEHMFRGRDSSNAAIDYASIIARIIQVALIDGEHHKARLIFSRQTGLAFAEGMRITESTTAASATDATVVVTGGLGVSGPAFISGALTATLTGSATSSPAGALTGATLAENVVLSSLTSLGTIGSLVATTADINGGTIDNTTIGATMAATGNFTDMTATGSTVGFVPPFIINAQGII